MKLLIVDDEVQIRNGLKDTIDWHSIGINSVLTARNGIEALQIFNNETPDIVLTDIRMPGMDGLELSVQIKTVLPDTKIYLISGYSDFNYAKQAISIGVEDYFVKPVDINVLMSKIQSSVNDIKKSKSRKSIHSHNSVSIKNKFFSRLIKDSQDSSPTPLETLHKMEIYFNNSSILCLLAELDNFDILIQKYGHQKIYELKEDLEKKIYASVYGTFPVVSYNDFESKHIVFFVNQVNANNIKILKNIINNFLFRYLDTDQYQATITVAAGNIINSINFSAAYKDALNTLKYKFFLGGGIVFFPDDIKHRSYTDIIPPHKYEREIIKAIEQQDANQLFQVTKILFDSYRFAKPSEIILIKQYLYDIFEIIQASLKHIAVKNLHKINLEKYNQTPKATECLDDYIIWIEEFALEHLEKLNKTAPGASSWFVERAKEYIDNNFSDDITLDDVAVYVNRNPNYLSHEFKKQTGITFTEYLNNKRIEEAKRLLRSTSDMTYEIAEKVGYYNYRYFSQMFKKVVGLTPTQYRQQS